MSDPDYCYPPSYTVLRNKLDIRDAGTLEAAERQFVAQRLLKPVPGGGARLRICCRRALGRGPEHAEGAARSGRVIRCRRVSRPRAELPSDKCPRSGLPVLRHRQKVTA